MEVFYCKFKSWWKIFKAKVVKDYCVKIVHFGIEICFSWSKTN